MYTLEYFINKLDEIGDRKYIPDTEDILRTQSHTRGQSASRLHVKYGKDTHVFEIIDAGMFDMLFFIIFVYLFI